MQSKALEKLIDQFDEMNLSLKHTEFISVIALLRQSHAIGLREGRKSRGKVVARGWAYGPALTRARQGDGPLNIYIKNGHASDIRVEVVAKTKEAKRGKSMAR